MNIVLLTIDCLRADRLSCMGYNRWTTPNIDKMVAKGLLFRQTIINGVGTFASFPSLMTSNHPFWNGTYERIDQRRRTLAEVLAEKGYTTSAFIDGNPYLTRGFGYDRGFKHFENRLDTGGLGSLKENIAKRWRTLSKRKQFLNGINQIILPFHYRCTQEMTGKTLTDEALKWIKNTSRKFFLWVHYMDLHGPHFATDEYFDKVGHETPSRQDMAILNSILSRNPEVYQSEDEVGKDQVRLLQAVYDAELRYVDDAIGMLLDEFQKMGISEKTLFIVTSDHGEEFYEHGRYHSHENFYEEMLRVPLIMKGGSLEQMVINRQVEQIDIAPTILDLVEEDNEPAWRGKSLLGPDFGTAYVVTEVAKDYIYLDGTNMVVDTNWATRKCSVRFAIDNDKWKYIFDISTQKEELYDLVQDPIENNNQIEARGEAGVRLQQLREYFMRHTKIEEQRMRIRLLAKKLKPSLAKEAFGFNQPIS